MELRTSWPGGRSCTTSTRSRCPSCRLRSIWTTPCAGGRCPGSAHIGEPGRETRKQRSANPKFYYFDTGVKRTLERTLDLPLQPGTYEYGKAFEHFVITQILHLSRYRYPDWRLFYLRTGAGVEIDVVIERPGMPGALIEIKSSDRIDERDVRRLARFTGDFTSPLALCISRDPTRMRMDGALCRHWREALEELGLR